MLGNTLLQIKSYFRNLSILSTETEKDIYELLRQKKVNKVLDQMEEHEIEVDNAISEYYPQNHSVMRRPNKYVKGESPYYTEKLPRQRQQYINEVELFFLLGNPIRWWKKRGEDEAFKMFMDYLDKIYFNTKIRQCKRLAGAETESAFVFHFFQKEGKLEAVPFIASRSDRYKIRVMFDQYKKLLALALGYTLSKSGKTINCWDILTAEKNYHCENTSLGWSVADYPNPTGRINAVYFRQPKAWAGVEQRIAREEMLDSRIADTNNYFADPIAAATADVVSNVPKSQQVGKLIQLTGSNSKFEYINPPQNSEIRKDEKNDLKQTILFDTLTPELSSEVMQSMGTLTSVGIKRALVLGYIKRANRMEIYEELVARLSHVILGVLIALNPDKRAMLEQLEVGFEFSEPFEDDKKEKWNSVANLYNQGVLSLELAVQMLALTDAPSEEIERLKEAEKKGGNDE